MGGGGSGTGDIVGDYLNSKFFSWGISSGGGGAGATLRSCLERCALGMSGALSASSQGRACGLGSG